MYDRELCSCTCIGKHTKTRCHMIRLEDVDLYCDNNSADGRWPPLT